MQKEKVSSPSSEISQEAKLFRAYHLAERLKLPSLLNWFSERPYRISRTELIYRFNSNQFIFIHSFGSIVFFDINIETEKKFLKKIQEFLSLPETFQTSEEFFLEEGGKTQVEFKKVVLQKITFEKIQLISLVLAQSTALEYFENIVGDLLQKSSSISLSLEKYGKIGTREKDLVRFIGFCLNTKQKIIASTNLLDDPDPTWESQTLGNLFHQMIEMFELRERYRTLEYKLKTVQETLEILSDFSRARSNMYLELAIIALIALEIILFVYDLIQN